MKFTSALSVCLPLAAAITAQGAITSVSGMVTQIGAPLNAFPGSLTAVNAWAWDEQQNVTLPPVPVELSTNASSSNAPVPGIYSGSTASHFIHFDGVPGMVVTGTVTFSQPILAVQYRDNSLDVTDALVSTGTAYPTTLPLRGFNNWTGADFVAISGNVLTFQFSTVSPVNNIEQVRVFTAVPTPGSLALLSLGGLAVARRRR